MKVWGYSDLGILLRQHPGVKNGIIVDTNILVSATYDLDIFHEQAFDFLDLIIEDEIPMYCNVNVRAEFLEAHRRIIFSEAILDFEEDCDKAATPPDLVSLLTNYKNRALRRKRDRPDGPPIKLSEAEIKEFKIKMIKVQGRKKNLWSELCDEKIRNKLDMVWDKTEKALGLNFLSLRHEDRERYLNEKPEWSDVTRLIGKHGISSSDAMIVNMFFVSKFEAIASSDKDIGFVVKGENRNAKHCLLPDRAKVL